MLNYRLQNKDQKVDQDFQLILKSNSLIARSYLDSPFFYMSLLIGDSFLFVQNAERPNEIFLKYDGEEPVVRIAQELLCCITFTIR